MRSARQSEPKKRPSPAELDTLDEKLCPHDDNTLKEQVKLLKKFFFLSLMKNRTSLADAKKKVVLECNNFCTLNNMDDAVICPSTYFDLAYKKVLLGKSFSLKTYEENMTKIEKLLNQQKVLRSGIENNFDYQSVDELIVLSKKILTLAEYLYYFETRIAEDPEDLCCDDEKKIDKYFRDGIDFLKESEFRIVYALKSIMIGLGTAIHNIIENHAPDLEDESQIAIEHKKIINNLMLQIFSLCRTLQYSTLLSTIKDARKYFKGPLFLTILATSYKYAYIYSPSSEHSLNVNYFQQITGEFLQAQVIIYNQFESEKFPTFLMNASFSNIYIENAIVLRGYSPALAIQYFQNAFYYLTLSLEHIFNNAALSQVSSSEEVSFNLLGKGSPRIKELTKRLNCLYNLIGLLDASLNKFLDVSPHLLEITAMQSQLETQKVIFAQKKQEMVERENKFRDKNTKQPKPKVMPPKTGQLALLPSCAENYVTPVCLPMTSFFSEKTITISEEDQKEDAENRRARYENEAKSQENLCSLVAVSDIAPEEKKYEKFYSFFTCTPFLDEEACLKSCSRKIASRFGEAKQKILKILEDPKPGYNVVFLSEAKNNGHPGFKLRLKGDKDGHGDLRLKGEKIMVDGKPMVRFDTLGTHALLKRKR